MQVLVDELEPQLVAVAALDRSALADAERRLVALLRIRARLLGEAADAEVLLLVAVRLQFDAQHVILGERVFDARLDVEAIVRLFDGVEARAIGALAGDRFRVVGIEAADRERERRLALDDRAVDRPHRALACFVAAFERFRVARVERVVAERERHRVAPLAVARPGANVDARESALVILGGERIEAEADFRDLRLRRQAAALEAVDAEHRARAGHLLEHLRHFVGVVRQLIDLFLRELRGERVVERLLGLVARDVDLLDERRDGERHLLVGVAAADVLLEVLRVESDRFDVDGVFAGRQVLEDRFAALAGLHGAIDAFFAPDAHGRIDDRRARFVDHRDAQRADVAPRVRGAAARPRADAPERRLRVRGAAREEQRRHHDRRE